MVKGHHIHCLKKSLAVVSLLVVATEAGHSQVLLSSSNYVNNFDTLGTLATGNPWTDNSTLLGWYISQSAGSFPNTYRAGTGSGATGAIYSFGSASSSERALGSLNSATPGNFAYGVRMANNTASTFSSFTVSYTGEQWRNGAPAPQAPHSLTFSYRISSSPITSSDVGNLQTWTPVSSLNFSSPTFVGAAGLLDGNNATNRTVISATITDTLAPGQEIFFRWFDTDDADTDHGLAVDNLSISVPEPAGLLVLGGLTALGWFWRRRQG